MLSPPWLTLSKGRQGVVLDTPEDLRKEAYSGRGGACWLRWSPLCPVFEEANSEVVVFLAVLSLGKHFCVYPLNEIC